MKKIILSFLIVANVFSDSEIIAQTINPSVAKTVTPSGATSNALANRRMTNFKPEAHGFKFSNTFVTPIDFAGINGLQLGGLCGGMVYSSLDYYNAKQPIPVQDFRPANKTTLQSYIYNRQVTSLQSNIDKWTELFVNPFGWRTSEFFNWGLQGSNGGRIQELKELIDKGIPAPLGLYRAGDGGFVPHHQVLAVGYEMGRYKGDLGMYKEDFKIFIYDPNFPNRVMTLKTDAINLQFYYVEDSRCKWLTYFVDKKYSKRTPPPIQTRVLPNDGLTRELVIEIKTGGDDLRGGNDNVAVVVNYTDGSSDTYLNVNNGARWIGNYCETVVLTLRKPAPLNQIAGITLKTSFGGGFNGDNWNVDELYVIARSGSGEQKIYERTGRPIVRFDGNNTPFTIRFR